jgi:hypothetical protein
VLALLVSAAPTRLPTATLVSLLEGPTGAVAASAVPPVDINAALARLDATHGGSTVAARAPRP